MDKCIKFECIYFQDGECGSDPLHCDCSYDDCSLGYCCTNCTNFCNDDFKNQVISNS